MNKRVTHIVQAQTGQVRGTNSNGVRVFKGIPFAAPPVGERRYREPAPPEPWQGALDATEFGPDAVQPPPPPDFPQETRPQSEDCLTINVWTPSADDANRPVMVWIHGGGFAMGGAARPFYDGAHLARRGDLVVVSFNYRLGALGFLHLDGIPANIGMLDQIAALRWVRDNIAAFGGDPQQVTIFGESAGGRSVAVLLAMPGAKGLFRRAIAQGGACQPLAHRAEVARKASEELLSEMGIADGDVEALLRAPLDDLREAQIRCMEETEPATGISRFIPVADGKSLPHPPLDAVRQGAARDISLLAGTNRDETRFGILTHFQGNRPDMETVHERVNDVLRTYGHSEDNARQLVETYQRAQAGRASTVEPVDVLCAFDTDLKYRMPVIRLIEAQSVHQANIYSYLFTWESPLLNGMMGSTHGLELPFVFGTLDAPQMDEFAGTGQAVEALSASMMDAWIAFARTGNPHHDGLPAWDAYDTARRATMVLGQELKLCAAPYDKERSAWDGIL